MVEEVLRVKRADVMRHLGLPHDEYDFTARFRIAEVEGVEDVVGIRVLARTRSGRAHTPLRLAPAVRARLGSVLASEAGPVRKLTRGTEDAPPACFYNPHTHP